MAPKTYLFFIDKLENAPNTFIVGCRSIDEEALKKASFGLKCANFLFKVETGFDCPDVRSGFRLYPLQLLKNVKFITTGHHFETEVLVRAAWKSISIDSVPITVGPTILKVNISPLKQLLRFASAFILHLCFIIIAFVYIKPRNFFRILINKKKRQVLLNQLFSSNYSPQVNAVSVGVGVFTGIIPIWGLQTFAALFFAIVFRLNKPLVIIASNISIPPMIPLVIFLSYRTGGYWMGKKNAAMPFSMHISLKLISLHLEQYIYGSLTLAFIAGLLAASLTFILLKVFKRSKFLQG